jgi:hypothetical protein
MFNSKISPLWRSIVIFGIANLFFCDNRGFDCFQIISFPLISMRVHSRNVVQYYEIIKFGRIVANDCKIVVGRGEMYK